MFGATEAGRVDDVHGFTLHVASDDYMRHAVETEVPGAQLILVLEIGHMGAHLTRAMWAELVSYGDQVFGIWDDDDGEPAPDHPCTPEGNRAARAGRGLASCGHPANEDGEHDCSSWPERAPYDTQAASDG